MLKTTVCFILLLLTSLLSFSQEENTLENQFDDVFNRSNNYLEFKVVKRTDLNLLKKSSLDSISTYKNALLQMQGELESQQIQLGIVQNSLNETNQKLSKTEQRENEISFLGIQTSKTAYNSIVWTIIIALAVLLFFFIFKFKNSNLITRETKTKLDELEKEFELHRHRTLEREQQLNRKLLDEVNKNKK